MTHDTKTYAAYLAAKDMAEELHRIYVLKSCGQKTKYYEDLLSGHLIRFTHRIKDMNQ